METFSLLAFIFALLAWDSVMKISKDMKKEFVEIKQKINMKSE